MIIKTIYNMQIMKPLISELIDVKKMPLRYIAKNQVRKSTAILLEIAKIIAGVSNEPNDIDKLRALSEELYQIVPFLKSNAMYFQVWHNEKIPLEPLISNLALVKEKLDVVETLESIRMAVKIAKVSIEPVVMSLRNLFRLQKSMKKTALKTAIWN